MRSVPSFSTSTRSSPLFEHSAVARGSRADGSLHRAHAGPAERGAGTRERAAGAARPEHDLPALVRLGLGGDERPRPQLDEVDRARRVLHRVELEDQPRPRLDREAVQPLARRARGRAGAASRARESRARAARRGGGAARRASSCARSASRRRSRARRRPTPRDGKVELDDVVAHERRRVRDDGRPTGRRRAGRLQRFAREVAAELLGLGEAHEDLRGDLVGGAAADRVVRRVLDHPAPREREELGGPRARRAARRAAPRSRSSQRSARAARP